MNNNKIWNESIHFLALINTYLDQGFKVFQVLCYTNGRALSAFLLALRVMSLSSEWISVTYEALFSIIDISMYINLL